MHSQILLEVCCILFQFVVSLLEASPLFSYDFVCVRSWLTIVFFMIISVMRSSRSKNVEGFGEWLCIGIRGSQILFGLYEVC